MEQGSGGKKGPLQVKRQNIADIKDGDSVQGTFAVRRKDGPRAYKNKAGRYFFLELGDRTGTITLKFWGDKDETRTMATFKSLAIGDVVFLTGNANIDQYDHVLVVSATEGVHVLERYTGPVDPDTFLPRSPNEMGPLVTRIDTAIASVKEPHLRSLLLSFFEDKAFRKEFMEAPSAINHHHNYMGGQLEHTAGVLRLCETLAEVHPGLDRDLLVTGALLHDVGKLRTYVCTTTIDRTSEGKFMGHSVIGERMVRDRIKGIVGFPEVLEMKISHMILRHMGEFSDAGAKGSGHLGGIHTPEACALHFADDADAQVKEFLQEAEAGRDVEKEWYYSPQLRTLIYLK
jgi:3'-5' exoribonuclease